MRALFLVEKVPFFCRRAAFGVCVFLLSGFFSPASAIDVNCSIRGGDAAGWAIATGGDYDGDGIADIAVGAPCSFSGSLSKSGRVFVYSGADGRRIATIRGTQPLQRLGAAVAFVGDVDGDGKDDLAVGSFAWDETVAGGNVVTGAGKVEMFSSSGRQLFAVAGTVASENFGESLVALPDVTGDGIADLLVGAGNARIAGERRGRASLLSGADGSIVDVSEGDNRFDGWGSVLGVAPDLTRDGFPEVIVASHMADILDSSGKTLTQNNGLVRVLSGTSFTDVRFEVNGVPEEKLGRAVDSVGPMGLIIGAPGADLPGLNKAGRVLWYSWNGLQLRSYTEPQPQVAAALGSAVAVIGDIDGDNIPDFAASAPAATVGEFATAGRVTVFSGNSGALAWPTVLEGTRPQARLGERLAVVPDRNGDGLPELAVGVPGDAPRGRRGAGSVQIVSGADGSPLLTLREGVARRRGSSSSLVVGAAGAEYAR